MSAVVCPRAMRRRARPIAAERVHGRLAATRDGAGRTTRFLCTHENPRRRSREATSGDLLSSRPERSAEPGSSRKRLRSGSRAGLRRQVYAGCVNLPAKPSGMAGGDITHNPRSGSQSLPRNALRSRTFMLRSLRSRRLEAWSRVSGLGHPSRRATQVGRARLGISCRSRACPRSMALLRVRGSSYRPGSCAPGRATKNPGAFAPGSVASRISREIRKRGSCADGRGSGRPKP